MIYSNFFKISLKTQVLFLINIYRCILRNFIYRYEKKQLDINFRHILLNFQKIKLFKKKIE